MTGFLQRCLDAALEERRRAAADPGLPPVSSTGDEPPARRDDVVIDLRRVWSVRGAGRGANQERERNSARSAVPATLTPAEPGAPVLSRDPASERCPRCRGTVRLDMFDAVDAVAHLTCLDCHLLFTARSPRA